MLNAMRRFWSILPRPMRTTAVIVGALLGLGGGALLAEYCWTYSDNTAANNPLTWECTVEHPTSPGDPWLPSDPLTGPPLDAADLSAQRILDEHYNWHCVNGGLDITGLGSGLAVGDPGYGNIFLGFHKQMINDFDVWRETFSSLNRIETWDPNPFPTGSDYNPMPWGIPGSGVSAADAGAIAGGSCNSGTGRAGNGVDPATFTRCPLCVELPPDFRIPPLGTLDTYASADDMGNDLDVSWHGTFHGGISAATDSAGNSCGDIGGSFDATRDAMFWRAHKALDDVHSAWQKLQAADLMIVLDRSGSMGDPAGPGSPLTKLEAAKEAVELFADLLEDGPGHTLGLVSYSSTATSPPELGLTAAAGVLPAIQAALSGISETGATSIGDGLLIAQEELTTNGANDRRAMLLLTDGKENRSPCLDGTGTGCAGSGSDFASTEFGDTQVCAIGYGEGSDLDGEVLRDLTERQGGIYTAFENLGLSGVPAELQLKKFFVDCLSDIFDEVTETDPFGMLPARRQESKPIESIVALDRKITFVLGWENAGDPLRLKITSPSGAVVDTADTALESSFGPTWHFVRIPLPYKGGGKGTWRAQAMRLDLPGRDQVYFISVLVAGPARLQPTNLRFHHYTGQDLLPTVRITAPYRPVDEFDSVRATVTVTRPTVSIGNVLAKHGIDPKARPREVNGDLVDARAAVLRKLEQEFGSELVPTKTETFPLYDDGTNGDRFANNHYWTTNAPGSAKAEGHYQFRFDFVFEEGGVKFKRQATHSVYVALGIDPEATKIDLQTLPPSRDGRNQAVVVFTPQDGAGNLLGPGRQDAFELTTNKQARLEGEIRENGRGTYRARVSWASGDRGPEVTITQNGQPRFKVFLANGAVQRGIPDLEKHLQSLLPQGRDRPQHAREANNDVQRVVSTRTPDPGQVVTVTVSPSGFGSWYFGIEEHIGRLEYTKVHTAGLNPGGTTFVMTKPNAPFEYQVKVPDTAKPGDQFPIQGQYWNNPLAGEGSESLLRTQTKETVLTVGGTPSETSVPQQTPSQVTVPTVGVTPSSTSVPPKTPTTGRRIGGCTLPFAGGDGNIYTSWLLMPALLGLLFGRNFIVAGLRLGRRGRRK